MITAVPICVLAAICCGVIACICGLVSFATKSETALEITLCCLDAALLAAIAALILFAVSIRLMIMSVT